MSYSAIICRAVTRPHPNAERLLLANCLGNQVVIGLDTEDRQLGIFFPTDGQLSHNYCVENHLYNTSARTSLGLPEGPTGFVDTKRRVRAQRFRGERSDGLWMPLTSLAWAGDIRGLAEGDQITEFGGQEICGKYYNPRTLRALKGQGKTSQKESRYFPKHIDTTQFRFVADTLPEDGIYYITEKLHGTSGRLAHVMDDQPLKPWQKWLNTHIFRGAGIKPKSQWTYLNGSRNVILERTAGEGFYGTNQFRYNAVRDIVLRKGEILYFELVGWVNDQTPIMPPHNTEKLQDKEFRKLYGPEMHYTYGCPPGVCRLYLYKIVLMNDDGIGTELSYSQMVARAHELGIPTVPLISGPLIKDSLCRKYQTDDMREALRKEVETLTSGSSLLDNGQIREGVVLRVESPTIGTTHIKSKSFEFGVMEGYLKDQDTTVDLEEIS